MSVVKAIGQSAFRQESSPRKSDLIEHKAGIAALVGYLAAPSLGRGRNEGG
jgi:hypothetical protein